MKMAPGALPRPGRVSEQRLLSPELGFFVAAKLKRVSGKILQYGSELGQEGIYGRRGDARKCRGPPGDPQARARTIQGGPRLAPPGGPVAPLRVSLWLLGSFGE